jgi:hypothetical protein
MLQQAAHAQAAYGARLPVRIGIDTGEVVVTAMAGGGSGEFIVVGDTVNRAARLQSAAAPGTVLPSAATADQVRGGFGLRRLGGLELQGLGAPVDAFVVEGVATDRSRRVVTCWARRASASRASCGTSRRGWPACRRTSGCSGAAPPRSPGTSWTARCAASSPSASASAAPTTPTRCGGAGWRDGPTSSGRPGVARRRPTARPRRWPPGSDRPGRGRPERRRQHRSRDAPPPRQRPGRAAAGAAGRTGARGRPAGGRALGR